MKKFCEKKNFFFWLLLPCLVVFAVVLSMSSGQYDISMECVLAAFSHAAGLPFFSDVTVTPEQQAVLWHIRLPRTLVGLMVGAGLGISGAVLQGIFSNPLADPGIIGVSSGASALCSPSRSASLPSASFRCLLSPSRAPYSPWGLPCRFPCVTGAFLS